MTPSRLAVHVRSALCALIDTPVPVNGTEVGEFAALLVKTRLVVAVPETLGVNATVTFRLCPVAIVFGSDRPGRVNSELFVCAAEMVTDPFEAVSVSGKLDELPTVTLPRLRLLGETPRVKALALVPVPERFTVSVGFCALLTSVTLPLIFPVTEGLKVTFIGTLLPGCKVIGK